MIKKDILCTLLLFIFLLCASPLSQAGKVNINRANSETIAAHLHGVGIKKANNIIKYRRSNGRFQSIGDLAKVKGIGEKTIQKNQSNILLSGSSDPL